MKAIKLFAICVLAVTLSSCADAQKSPVQMPKAQVDSVSEALGAYFANMITSDDFGDLNIAKINSTLQQYVKEGKALERDEFQTVMTTIQNFMMERQARVSEYNYEEGLKFLEANKANEGVQVTESGLQYQILEEGTGISPKKEDTVVVNYLGTLIDGEKFDSSYDREEPLTIPLTSVIPGWAEGLTYCKEGGKIKMWIPAELAYGDRGPAAIGPNQVLVFECELLEVKAVAQEEAAE